MLDDLIRRYLILDECKEDIEKAKDALIECYKNGDLFFENQKVKNAFMKIIRKCLSY